MFHVVSMARPRRMAKALRALLVARSLDVPLSSCQEAVARMYGYASWHALGKADRTEASPSDDACSPDEAAARRALQISVLTTAGIPVAIAEAVVVELRPTGRGDPDAVACFPRFVVRAVELSKDGSERVLAPQDLTGYVVHQLRSRGLASVEREIAEGFVRHYVSGSLDGEARTAAYADALRFDDVRAAWDAFVEKAGDVADSRVAGMLEDRWSEMGSTRQDLEDALLTLEEVRGAAMADAADFQMFVEVENFLVSSDEGYVHELDQAYDGWGWEDFASRHPRPGFGTPESADWDRMFVESVRGVVPPFVFGTVRDEWNGVDPADVRRWVEEEGSVPDALAVDQILDDALSDQHEDARDHVRRSGRLFEIVEEWCAHAGSGDEVDLALEGRLAAWNARQSIQTFQRDPKSIVAIGAPIAHADAVAWCERDVVRCRRAIVERDRWERPVLSPLPERSGRSRVGANRV